MINHSKNINSVDSNLSKSQQPKNLPVLAIGSQCAKYNTLNTSLLCQHFKVQPLVNLYYRVHTIKIILIQVSNQRVVSIKWWEHTGISCTWWTYSNSWIQMNNSPDKKNKNKLSIKYMSKCSPSEYIWW